MVRPLPHAMANSGCNQMTLWPFSTHDGLCVFIAPTQCITCCLGHNQSIQVCYFYFLLNKCILSRGQAQQTIKKINVANLKCGHVHFERLSQIPILPSSLFKYYDTFWTWKELTSISYCKLSASSSAHFNLRAGDVLARSSFWIWHSNFLFFSFSFTQMSMSIQVFIKSILSVYSAVPWHLNLCMRDAIETVFHCKFIYSLQEFDIWSVDFCQWKKN